MSQYSRGASGHRLITPESTLEVSVVPETWMDDAACVGMDVELFFPKVGNPIAQEAQDACDVCIVSSKCLLFAMQWRSQDQHGLYGGVSAKDRRTKSVALLEALRSRYTTDDVTLDRLRKAGLSDDQIPGVLRSRLASLWAVAA